MLVSKNPSSSMRNALQAPQYCVVGNAVVECDHEEGRHAAHIRV
jgi:hypothetical protein